MCGITGLWAPGVEPELARRMADAIRYRGPDAGGLWSDGGAGVSFGHRRLAIVDLSPTGVQPMASASGRFVISFNGEVYNYRALREELEKAGRAPAFRGSSDTEVMLACIEAWGLEGAVDRFIGMFAFALFDLEERRLHLVRDRLGIKPLYITRTPSGMAFASELKALRLFPGFDTTLNRDVLAGYLASNCVPGARSIFKGTEHVAPGTIVTFDGPRSEGQVVRYWDPVKVVERSLASPFTGSDEEAVDTFVRLALDGLRVPVAHAEG